MVCFTHIYDTPRIKSNQRRACFENAISYELRYVIVATNTFHDEYQHCGKYFTYVNLNNEKVYCEKGEIMYGNNNRSLSITCLLV